ncbi:GTPase Era [Hypsizygus marmoreus]|uniref:GTPase Era n=1 Tax=Hypsizygus marmoreus TaxID=39966 RepID=A0A369K7S6_HYPMA|nr:GTPase Era [Hypsizygus marmoreus]
MAKRSKLDNVMTDARESDTFIVVLGQTGAGKSTFINTAVGKEVTRVGHELKPQTQKVRFFPVTHPKDRSRRVIFVDTPGFNDTHIEDSETLDHILKWMELSFSSRIRSTRIGIVYLHEITQNRGDANQAGMSPVKLCTPGIKEKVVLATTKWQELPREEGLRRLQQLMEKYSRSIAVAEFQDTHTSAWATINPIFEVDRLSQRVSSRFSFDVIEESFHFFTAMYP